MKQIILGIAILCIGLSTTMRNGGADEIEKNILALEAIKVLNFEQQINKISQELSVQLIAAMKKNHANFDDSWTESIVRISSDELNRFTPEITLFLQQSMVKYYNEDDLRYMVAFYKSETGQKALKFLPQMKIDVNQWIYPKISKVMGTIKDRLEKELEIQM